MPMCGNKCNDFANKILPIIYFDGPHPKNTQHNGPSDSFGVKAQNWVPLHCS